MSAFNAKWKLSESGVGVKAADNTNAICTVNREISRLRREDIARLIARAPELFNALDTLSYLVLVASDGALICIDDMLRITDCGGAEVGIWQMAEIARKILHQASPETHEAPGMESYEPK
jgi:hypothetical protein